MIPKIIDNDRKVFLDVLRNIVPKYDELSIATGYWDLLGTQLLIEEFKKFKKIRLLIGREPIIPRYKTANPEPNYPDQDIFADLESLPPDHSLKQTIIDLKNLIKKGILEVKVYRKSFLHAKCYIFGNYNSSEAIGIIGSSNFTQNGLTRNKELNALESDHRIVTFQPKSKEQEVGHLFWFDQFWNDPTTEDWQGRFTELLEESPVGDILFSSYETYIKTLYELYKEELVDDILDVSLYGTHELLDYQKKNVHALIRRLNKYRVAMLSDSVGLGKTYTAIEVVKQYLDSEEGKKRVVIVCPKSIKKQWSKELLIQGVYHLTPTTLQNKNEIDSAQELDHIASVSLFVIDESHNLRKTTGKRYEQLLEWMRSNPKAHVLLVTATPINNQLADITNQVLLGARGQADIFKMTVVDHKTKQTVPIDFAQAIKNLLTKINQDIKRGDVIDYAHIRQVMTPIIRTFVVRRTRQGIEKEYGYLLMDGRRRCFPDAKSENTKYSFNQEVSNEIRKIQDAQIPLDKIYLADPESLIKDCKDLKHPLDQLGQVKHTHPPEYLDGQSPTYFIFQLILMLGFIPYRWRMYQTKYYGKTLQQIRDLHLDSEESESLQLQVGIYGILRTIFLKRMESSVSSILKSVKNYQDKLDKFEKGVQKNKIVSLKNINAIEAALGDLEEDIDPEDVTFSEEEREEIFLDDIDEQKYCGKTLHEDIEKEKRLISLLLSQIHLLEKDDSKLKSLVDLLERLNRDKPAGNKVLVFSYFADTVNYLEKNIKRYTKLIKDDDTAFVSSRNRTQADRLACQFSPKAKDHEFGEGEKELRYLFSTDVLSEGQNLQDCGVIVNYDLHWNPVRMIQRNGRVNRLGSEHETVYVYNMSPEHTLENYLRLVERLKGKIELIRHTIGTDQPVLDEIPNPIEYTDSIEEIYSEDEQVRYKAPEKCESTVDFLLSEDEYVIDLKKFHANENYPEEYKRRIYQIARGKWAVFPKMTQRSEERPQVMAFARLMGGGQEISLQFARMNQDGKEFKAVTILQALEWLKTLPEDNKRTSDKINYDRKVLSKITKSNIAIYLEEDEPSAPAGQQIDVLRLMYEQHHQSEDIEAVRASFNTRNVLDEKKIRQLVRQIAKAKKENKPYFAEMNKLINIAKKTIQEKIKPQKIDRTDLLLYYVNDNS